MPPRIKYVEVGRVAYAVNGAAKGKLLAIVDIIDYNRVLVDGPMSDVRRQEYKLNQLKLTPMKIKIGHSEITRLVKTAWERADVDALWKRTTFYHTLLRKSKRRNLTDYDRFRVSKLRQRRSKLVQETFANLKTHAIKEAKLRKPRILLKRQIAYEKQVAEIARIEKLGGIEAIEKAAAEKKEASIAKRVKKAEQKRVFMAKKLADRKAGLVLRPRRRPKVIGKKKFIMINGKRVRMVETDPVKIKLAPHINRLKSIKQCEAERVLLKEKSKAQRLRNEDLPRRPPKVGKTASERTITKPALSAHMKQYNKNKKRDARARQRKKGTVETSQTSEIAKKMEKKITGAKKSKRTLKRPGKIETYEVKKLLAMDALRSKLRKGIPLIEEEVKLRKEMRKMKLKKIKAGKKIKAAKKKEEAKGVRVPIKLTKAQQVRMKLKAKLKADYEIRLHKLARRMSRHRKVGKKFKKSKGAESEDVKESTATIASEKAKVGKGSSSWVTKKPKRKPAKEATK